MVSDTSEGRTIFIRNLSFDVEEDALYTFFSQFGPLEFAKIVKDPATQHSRGTAFVKFVNAEDASNVLQQSDKPENAHQFSLENRTLKITIAVSRTEAQNLRKRKHEDDASEGLIGPADAVKQKGRNLHLASIGIIRPGSSEAEGLSKEDLARRDALLREKKKKLTDPNYFISDVRLCLRNLPLHVSDDELKSACMKFLKKSTDHRILECRIMRNLQPGRQQYRSLGYGFVAFTNHENALSVLYGLNNNPNAFPPSNRRPIVEFSLENMRALQLKQKRAEKCLMLQSKTKESSSTPQLFTKNVQRNPQKTKSILTSKSSNSTIYKKSKMNNNPNYNNKLKKKLYLSKNNTQQKSSILPKHFGPKKRHRHRGRLAAAAAASKPKQKKTRKQKRAAKNT
ncbi:RNA-binding protein 28, variant 2 [Schistosoma haematobium]|uniref:RNA-binding protein 28, variant 2 n=1 Tax=Schistosoma haematobium TaxID=6185 RepID=A0A922IJL6_SCHHA|nr:RNA-binding protein 28, variant 2 [Schistosoma haematobium]KAH9580298.1 RNA-binding protein 28, variant 2 [Schistosoma haematobium]